MNTLDACMSDHLFIMKKQKLKLTFKYVCFFFFSTEAKNSDIITVFCLIRYCYFSWLAVLSKVSNEDFCAKMCLVLKDCWKLKCSFILCRHSKIQFNILIWYSMRCFSCKINWYLIGIHASYSWFSEFMVYLFQPRSRGS